MIRSSRQPRLGYGSPERLTLNDIPASSQLQFHGPATPRERRSLGFFCPGKSVFAAGGDKAPEVLTRPTTRYLRWRLDHLLRPPESRLVSAAEPVMAPPHPYRHRRRRGYARRRSPKCSTCSDHKSTLLFRKSC